MARLINEMKVLGETAEGELITVDAESVKNVGMDKIIEAIHLVQQQLGITGTTAKEAEGTISGSMGQMAAAFENLKVAFATGDGNEVRGWVETLTKSVEIALKNAIPRIKNIVKGMWTGIKKVLRDNVPGVANELIPFIEKIKDVFTKLFDFVKKNGDTIINVLKGIAAAFIAIKAATMLQSVVAGIGAFFSAFNPASALVITLGALVGVMAALSGESDKLSAEDEKRIAEAKEMSEKANEAANAWENLKKVQEDYVKNESSELGYYENLWKELQKITEENGKIKEGYEARAKYIAEKLGDIYGEEILIVDGVISKYEELRQKMGQVMEQRRAEIILKGQEALFEDAIAHQDEYSQKYAEAARKYKEAEAELAKTDARWQEVQRELSLGTSNKSYEEFKALQKESSQLVKQRDAWREQLGQSDASMKQYRNLLEEGLYYITNYEKNMELMQEGHYDQLVNLGWEYVRDAKDLDEAQRNELKDQYDGKQALYDIALEMQKKYQDEAYRSAAEFIKGESDVLAEHLKELGIYVQDVTDLYSQLPGVGDIGLPKTSLPSAGGSVFGWVDAIGQAVQNALNGTKVEMDGEEMGRVITSTVTRQVYSRNYAQ